MINIKGVAIQYGDVAPGAKENFEPEASESKYNTLSQLKQYNLKTTNYANPCELYQTMLDGTATAFPSMPENANLGLWSNQISNDDGTFAEPIVLELESVGQYSSQGLTLTFDTYNGIYATRLGIKWLRITDEGITTLDEKEYNPDNAFYFCRNFIENYNKVVITFYSLNMPKNRLKLSTIDYGYGTIFQGKELRNVRIIQEIDPISTEITINTADFTLDSKTDIEYSFQAKQPLSIYFNGELKATTFVKSAKRKSKTLWDIQSEDYIGILDKTPYYGGMYDNDNAFDILKDIFDVGKVPYYIDNTFSDVTVSGYIPYTTCRNALMQVAFAIQAVIDTSNSDGVKVFKLNNDIKQTIPLTRIMQGQNFVESETVTGIEVTSHKYKAIDESVEVYNAEESGSGNNIFIKFSEPLYDLVIGNGTFATDKNGKELKHTNYAVINANPNCILVGKKYEHTTQTHRKNNPVVLENELENVVTIENATLVSNDNVFSVLNNAFEWLTKTNSTNLKIVEGKHVKYGRTIKYGSGIKYGTGYKYGQKTPNVVTYDEPVQIGNVINAETEYIGQVNGRIIKQSFNLNGNIVVKEAVLK